jgi:hypothetical protein
VQSRFAKEFDDQKSRKAEPRKRRRRKLTRDEKEILAKDLTLKEVELADGKEELKTLNREIALATPVIRAIMRNEELVAMLPREVKPELERFAKFTVSERKTL